MPETVDIWSNWIRIGEIAINAFLFYVLIIAMVRLVGKRTTSELNNFDWIINVAVGSLAASGILLRNVATVDAVTAILVLATCQYVTTKIVLRSKTAARIVKAEPTLLTHKGEFLRDAMKRTRISEEEIKTALRSNGMTDVSDANWVVLETNGELSVIPRQDVELSEAHSLSNVESPKKLDD